MKKLKVVICMALAMWFLCYTFGCTTRTTHETAWFWPEENGNQTYLSRLAENRMTVGTLGR